MAEAAPKFLEEASLQLGEPPGDIAISPPPGACEPPAKRLCRAGPPPFGSVDYVAAEGEWWAHRGGEWLYNVEEKTYFHLPSGELLFTTDDGISPTADTTSGVAGNLPECAPTLRGRVRWFNAAKGFGFIEPFGETVSPDIFVHRNQLRSSEDDPFASLRPGTSVSFTLGETEDGRACAIGVYVDGGAAAEDGGASVVGDGDEAAGEDAGEEEESSSASSVEIDLMEELYSGMYQVKGAIKDHCEDFSVQKVKVPISALGETATCVFFGVFDGHGGSYCAEYAAAHMGKNLLSRLHDRTKNVSDEVALRAALLGGFKQTEHNFLQHARRVGDNSGSTACTMTVFGPDEHMRLRLFLANLGDSRAVLGKVNGQALRLTEDHKPNLPHEKKRIEQEGGSIGNFAGVWRCVLPLKRRSTSGIVGLAVSRSLGDKDFKGPDIVSAEPTITTHDLDWDNDEVVIIASDGVWDVVTDKKAVRNVQRSLREGRNEEQAAETLIRFAVELGSQDDCTVVVVRFGWVNRGGEAQQPDADLGEAEAQSEDGSEVGEVEVTTGDATEAMTTPVSAKDVAGEAEPPDIFADTSEEEFNLVRSDSKVGVEEDACDDDDNDDDDVDDRKLQTITKGKTVLPSIGDAGGLFEGLGPTREELAVPEGPALPDDVQNLAGVKVGASIATAAEEEEEEEAALAKSGAVDDDMDMFGA